MDVPQALEAIQSAAAVTGDMSLTVVGQVCRKRELGRNLIFLSLRPGSCPRGTLPPQQPPEAAAAEAAAPFASTDRLQLVARLDMLGHDGLAAIRRFTKLGDIIQAVGRPSGGELLLTGLEVAERWAHSHPQQGFVPDIEPPNAAQLPNAAQPPNAAQQQQPPPPPQQQQAVTARSSSSCNTGVNPGAPLCKFWLGSGSCARTGCRFSH